MSSSPSPPPAPDPTATAAAQTTSNVNTAAAQAALNNVNQYTPYGATTYQQTGTYTTPSGETVPTYTQNTQLSPLAQSLLTGSQTIGNQLLTPASTLAGYVGNSATTPLNFNTPFSSTINNGPQSIAGINPNYAGTLSTAPGQIMSGDPYYASVLKGAPSNLTQIDPAYASTLGQAPQALNSQVTNAIYGQEKSFLDPQWNLQQTQLQDQLSRQGIPVGSDAYNNAMSQLTNARTQAYQSAQDSAIGQGVGAASNLFGMALQGQQAATGREQAAEQAALAGQGQMTAQQQAAFEAALQGQGQMSQQRQAAFQAALQGQQMNVGQQQLAQSNPLSLLQQIFGSTPGSPQQPISQPGATTVSPTDFIGAQGLSTQAQQQAYQAQLAAQNAQNGGLASLAGTAIVGGAIVI